MREPTIVRNYAEALVALAQKAEDLQGWGAMISDVADAVQRDRKLGLFLESPRVSADQKNDVIGKAFQDRMPRLFVRFLQALVRHRRQNLISPIAVEYGNLMDEIEGRLHAQVTVAREPDESDKRVVAQQLSRVLGKDVVPHFSVNPAIIGGAIVRVGDRIMDGSVRRRLAKLRYQMLAGAAT